MQQKVTNLFGEEEYMDDGVTVRIFTDEEILDTAFNDFRQRGFPYPDLPLFKIKRILNDLANVPFEQCVHSNVGYRIADTYHKHRFHSAAISMYSPFDSFNDDTKLKKVLRKQFEAGGDFEYGYLGFMSLVSGTQACSNFRPAFAKMLYNKYSPKDGKVFDSSTGFGGRLVGFLASHCSEYHGTDPNTITHLANQIMCEDIANHKKVVLYNLPAEDLDVSHLEEYFDFSFTSPPYFKKEIYSKEETQSCNRYPEYHDWINCFLRPMMQKQFFVMKKDCNCIINIEDVKIKGKEYKLLEPTIEIGKEVGFTHDHTDIFPLQARTMMINDEKVIIQANEKVIVFKKH